MKTVPKIGQRVRYWKQNEYEREPRTCTGTVTKIYVTHDYDFDDEDEPILSTERTRQIPDWHAAMTVDRPLPKWWAYGQDKDVFAPCLEDLEIETKNRRRA